MSHQPRKISIQFLPGSYKNDFATQDNITSPQIQPLVVYAADQQVCAALMIENAVVVDSIVEVFGWCVGVAEFSLNSPNKATAFRITRQIRKDVAAALSISEPDDGLGFYLRATLPAELSECEFNWTIFQDGHRTVYHFPLVANKPDSSEQKNEAGETTPSEQHKHGQTCFDRFVGSYAHGWVFDNDYKSCAVNVRLNECYLGAIQPNCNRLDVQAAFKLESEHVGFRAMLGGLLQFSVLSQNCQQIALFRPGQPKQPLILNLANYLAEALTFSPLAAFTRHEQQAYLGGLRSIRFISRLNIEFMFETGIANKAPLFPNSTAIIDFYQENTSDKLTLLQRFTLELNGQIVHLPFNLISEHKPILIVVTDLNQNIVLTDSIPVPALFLEKNLPIIEYHSTLYSGRQYYQVAAMMMRNYLDVLIRQQLNEAPLNDDKPSKANTALLLFVGNDYDSITDEINDDFYAVSDKVLFLERDGYVTVNQQHPMPLLEAIASLSVDFVLICELNTTLRIDFWAIVAQHLAKFDNACELISWDFIASNGWQRPYLIKQPLLLDDAFAELDTLASNSVLVSKSLLTNAITNLPNEFRSGILKLQRVFHDVPASKVTRVPIALAVSRVALPIPKQQECFDNQLFIKYSSVQPTFKQTGGISIIINYHDNQHETFRCLESIYLQQFSGAIEIILVNNRSIADVVKNVTERAISLFGDEHVITLDHNSAFNLSKQCNMAAKHATHNILFILDNHAVLINPLTLSWAREITTLSWVGTCGFRMIGTHHGKPSLKSLGLSVARDADVFIGGRFVMANQVPSFLADKTLEVIANTFSAVAVRKQVYEELAGLDEVVFPTYYNDVDFCLRASKLGYRHIAIGTTTIEHLDSVLFEPNLDLPLTQSIYECSPELKELVSIGVFRL